MKPYFTTNTVTLYHGSALDVLKGLPGESVQTCVTSPPYFGLRAYGTDPQIWQDGQPLCAGAHDFVERQHKDTRGVEGSTLEGRKPTAARESRLNYSEGFCARCGAWRGELGLEPTPELYVEHLVAIFREVKRVLRDDGTLWVNIGDSYAAQRGGTPMPAETLAGGVSGQGDKDAKRGRESAYLPHRNAAALGLKHKDLIGIPWMLAFALRADGWYLRQDIIWSKPNPMPESVEDRCTKAHEYLFLLSKSPSYFYNAKAIAEEAIYKPGGSHSDVPQGGFNDKGSIPGSGQRSFRAIRETRNKRSVWSVSTRSFPDAHFAVFPPELIEPCIKAGCPEGGTVLDPFSGSGTTLAVADRLGRKAVGIELNESYCAMHKPRFAQNNLFSLVENV